MLGAGNLAFGAHDLPGLLHRQVAGSERVAGRSRVAVATLAGAVTFVAAGVASGLLIDEYGGVVVALEWLLRTLVVIAAVVFIVGAALFGLGSLLASEATSVGQLILGEAVIEGVGAALMMPSTLAILSTTFRGRERATAFAAWGATAGVAAAIGPRSGSGNGRRKVASAAPPAIVNPCRRAPTAQATTRWGTNPCPTIDRVAAYSRGVRPVSFRNS